MISLLHAIRLGPLEPKPFIEVLVLVRGVYELGWEMFSIQPIIVGLKKNTQSNLTHYRGPTQPMWVGLDI